jgi:hypothetical protein
MSAGPNVVSCAIHPGIGIARLGNSPHDFFLAPQFPGQVPKGPYKDAAGRIKRQAAQFRIYGLDAKGNAVEELIDGQAGVKIEWTVHLANRKGAWYQFTNALDLDDLAIDAAPRNPQVEDRSTLVIDPGPRTISGAGQHGQMFDTGTFLGNPVYLGELRTDEQGRLQVLGGRGVSGPADGQSPVMNFANNDGWYDDISDGTVRAKVTIHGKLLAVKPAFVVAAVPNFGQGLYAVVSMYDLLLDLFEGPQKGKVSFWRDVYPIFHRLVQCQWVNEGIYFLLGVNSPSGLTADPLRAKLADNTKASKPVRMRIFEWFRDPDATIGEPVKLPPFYGDEVYNADEIPTAFLAVTRRQYAILRRWASGDFSNDPKGMYRPPESLEKLAPEKQPGALDRASLEECVGGPFHPGMEMTWIMRTESLWAEPFRLRLLPEAEPVRDDYGTVLTPARCFGAHGPLRQSGPGTISRWMGLPWQADAASCLSGYDHSTYLPLPTFWAVRVPNQVLSSNAYERVRDQRQPLAQRLKHLDHRQFWLRDLRHGDKNRMNDMVANWHRLGIVAHRSDPSDKPEIPAEMWVETERRHDFGGGDPTWQQVLIAENKAEVSTATPSDSQEQSDQAPANASHPQRRQHRRVET